MTDLVQRAAVLLEEKYNSPVHTVSAALKTESGKIITAVNIDHFLGFVCVETAALTIAINQGEYKFRQIVAMRKKDDTGEITIANMCGKCRQIFHDYAPGIEVVTENGIRKIEELLPDAFTRQRGKIQTTIRNVQ